MGRGRKDVRSNVGGSAAGATYPLLVIANALNRYDEKPQANSITAKTDLEFAPLNMRKPSSK
jgi:hypothetical protein